MLQTDSDDQAQEPQDAEQVLLALLILVETCRSEGADGVELDSITDIVSEMGWASTQNWAASIVRELADDRTIHDPTGPEDFENETDAVMEEGDE